MRTTIVIFVGLSVVLSACETKTLAPAKTPDRPPIELAEGLSRAPVLGLYHRRAISLRLRTKGATPLRVQYRLVGDDSISSTDTITPTPDHDFSAHLSLTDLEPDQGYEYRVSFASGEPTRWYRFRTFPGESKPAKFRFVFSGCLREKYQPHRVFRTIKDENPTFLALLGDSIYADYDGDINDIERSAPNAERMATAAFRGKYSRNLGPYFQDLSPVVPVLATWDDHDFGQDNSDRTFPYRSSAKKVFLEVFPEYPLVSKKPADGIHYRFRIAGIDIFVLDTRWYRTPMQTAEGRTMLGEAQLQWLLDGLKESKSPFKFVFSSVPMNEFGADTSSGRPGFDSWIGYPEERQRILDFIRAQEIKGVLIFSGDQHYPSAHVLNWKGPIQPQSKGKNRVSYAIHQAGTAVFDFSASPFGYHRGHGAAYDSKNQGKEGHAYELYRPQWARPSHFRPAMKKVVESIYGVVDVDTSGKTEKVSVTFKRLDRQTNRVEELYRIDLHARE